MLGQEGDGSRLLIYRHGCEYTIGDRFGTPGLGEGAAPFGPSFKVDGFFFGEMGLDCGTVHKQGE
jgi:hypothetical protein